MVTVELDPTLPIDLIKIVRFVIFKAQALMLLIVTIRVTTTLKNIKHFCVNPVFFIMLLKPTTVFINLINRVNLRYSFKLVIVHLI